MERIEELFGKHQSGKITKAELDELFLELEKADRTLLSKLTEKYLDAPVPSNLDQLHEPTENLLERINKQINSKQRRSILKLWYPWIAAAAALAGSLYFVYKYNSRDMISTTNEHAQVISDVAPGGKRATLTLADGRTIVLDNANTGQLAKVAGTVISKTSNGELIYQDQAPGSDEVQNNVVSIPRGGEYQLQLPDGTKVRLNAATKIEYPTRFTGAERRVVLTGEAYFEVTKDAKHPFIVETADQQIKVLGTHFNVNTYQADRTITTLEEGSVRVSSLRGTKQSQTISPGQQSVLFNGGLEVSSADMESALAWKNGMLFFRDAPLQTVLAEVSRWYDVDIQYNGKPTQELFTGSVARTSNLSAMLRILQLTGVKTKLVAARNSRKLIIEP
ncbi:FecR family protein [Pedobacter sp.]